MALFGGTALAAGLVSKLAWFPPHPDMPFGFRMLFVANVGIAAGLAAAISFWLLNRLRLRLTRGPWPLRAVVLAASTITGGHLLIGFVHSTLYMLESVILPELPTLDAQGFFSNALGIAIGSVFIGWSLTLPGGFAAAMLLEWLEARRSQTPKGPAKAVE